MSVLLTPAERLSRLQVALPDATLLAQALSLCVRAEPELVRQIRLILFPRSSAALEADLYFSPLVAQRTPDWILLDPQLTLELQDEAVRLSRKSSDDWALMARIRQVVQQAHSPVPFEIACEEEVIWLAVQRGRSGVKEARAAVDRILRGLLMRLLQSSEESLAIARWFASACRRMPMLARETQAFALLAFAASSKLGGRKIETSANASLATFEELARYLPESAPRIALWMAPTSRGLHVVFVPVPGYERIEVPHTNPVLLELRLDDGARVLMQLTPPQPGFVPLPAGSIGVRTLSRDLLLFQPRTPNGQARTEIPQIAFKNDVYISYSHLDSDWVTQFQKVLEMRLAMLSGRHVRIFSDPKLSGGDEFDESIPENILSSAAMVAVITPAYLESNWCRRELDTFLKGAEQTGGLMFGAQSRAIPVFRMPVPRDQIPTELNLVAGYRFYRPAESEADRFLEFGPSSREFYDGLDRLAQDIQRLLQQRPKELPDVFLTATTDLEAWRERLAKELAVLGIRISTTREDLDSSSACVFLIGEEWQGNQEAVITRALELRKQGYVWTPRDLDISRSGEREAFLDRLERESRIEVLRTGFEDLVDYLGRVLRTPEPHKKPDGSPSRLICVICAEEDREAAESVTLNLRDSGLMVEMPVFSGGPRELREARRGSLLAADGVLIYWGRGGEPWFRANLSEAIRATRGGGKDRPAVIAVYVAPPSAPEKQAFEQPGIITIHEEKSTVGLTEHLVRAFAGGDAAR